MTESNMTSNPKLVGDMRGIAAVVENLPLDAIKNPARDYVLSAVAHLKVGASEIERLRAERDEWAQKANAWRAKYAELRYPGMQGVVHAAGVTDETTV